jgi:PhzF family phenazine biosynthesis protein
MKLPLYQVDAFTNQVFKGNPAAVCLMESWLDDTLLQNIASENNLSETAFLVPRSKGQFDLRWFTPTLEVDLCGHATLASAFIIFEFVDQDLTSIGFETASGHLSVTRSDNRLVMDFPARVPEPVECPALLPEALGADPVEVHASRDLLAVFENESIVKAITPDFDKLNQIKDTFAVMVSAPGDDCDFVSRFFAPKAGILEDPVTGSAHCTLIPFWAARLGKHKLHARQVSQRGGELFCELMDNRVRMAGHAVLYAKGEIYI